MGDSIGPEPPLSLPSIDRVYPQGCIGKPRRGSRWDCWGGGGTLKGKVGLESGCRGNSGIPRRAKEKALPGRAEGTDEFMGLDRPSMSSTILGAVGVGLV